MVGTDIQNNWLSQEKGSDSRNTLSPIYKLHSDGEKDDTDG